VTEQRGRRTRFSTQVSETIQDRTRATIDGVRAATGKDYSLAGMTEDALEMMCRYLEELYNEGQPYPTTAPRLRPGRKVS
jgi:hypothetical protein